MTSRALKYALIGCGALLASGCWVHYHYRHGPAPVSPSVVFVRRAPPPPLRPRIPPRPAATAIWIGGYWRWSGVDFVWVDGFWERRPPVGRVWVRDKWIHTNRGWYRRPGRWK